MQSRSCAALWTPPRSINASLVFARQLNRTRDEPGVSRKVWSAIVFGFELEMLRLHLATLADAVDGFLVTGRHATAELHARGAHALGADRAGPEAAPPRQKCRKLAHQNQRRTKLLAASRKSSAFPLSHTLAGTRDANV